MSAEVLHIDGLNLLVSIHFLYLVVYWCPYVRDTNRPLADQASVLQHDSALLDSTADLVVVLKKDQKGWQMWQVSS